MHQQFKAAALQMASGPNVSANLLEAKRLIGEVVAKGAQLIVLPENFAFMGQGCTDLIGVAEAPGQGPIQQFLSSQARQHRIWLIGGTTPIIGANHERVRSACLVYNDQGELAGRYDKIHLFDVRLVEANEDYSESKAIEPGELPLVIDTPFGRLGVAICYDLRFPELFRLLIDQGAELIALPSAFTATTGRAHWHVLVRARAIENLCFMLASAQGGFHINGRQTYGHSMLVDPWGTVLHEAAQGSGYAIADLDRRFLASTRLHFPSLHHRRLGTSQEPQP